MDLENAIRTLTAAVAGILDGRVRGVWLYGSVVLDDFRPGWSDVDLLVLAEEAITEAQALELVGLRQSLSAAEPGNPYFRAFEGIVAAAEEYRAGAFRRLVYWGTSGQRITDRYERDVFAAYELAKYGRCVFGRDDRSLFPVPTREELTAAVRAHCAAIRSCAVRTDERLYSCGWLLDMARCVRTLRRHDVVSKTEAGLWALEEHIFPEEEALRKTLEIRRDPLRYRDREDVRQWLRELGPVVQRYADVLERELEKA